MRRHLVMVGFVLSACASTRDVRTESFSRRIMANVVDGALVVRGTVFRPGEKIENVAAQCSRRSAMSFGCAVNGTVELVSVGVWRDSKIRDVHLYGIQGQSQWLCTLANSIAIDLSNVVGRAASGAECVCPDPQCYVGSVERTWPLGTSTLSLSLATSVEHPLAPDETALASLLITLHESPPAPDGGPVH